MIQRIQSIWLLLAAASFFILYKFPLGITSNKREIFAEESLPIIGLGIFMGIFAIALIFMYKKRKNQKKNVLVNMLLGVLLLVLIFFQVRGFESSQVSVEFKLGAIYPIVFILFSSLAYASIAKDEKLLKKTRKLR